MDSASLHTTSDGDVMHKSTFKKSDQWNTSLDSTMPLVLISTTPKVNIM